MIAHHPGCDVNSKGSVFAMRYICSSSNKLGEAKATGARTRSVFPRRDATAGNITVDLTIEVGSLEANWSKIDTHLRH